MAGQWLAFLAAAGMAGRIQLRTSASSPSCPEALGGSGRGERAHYPREPRRRPGADATKMLTPSFFTMCSPSTTPAASAVSTGFMK